MRESNSSFILYKKTRFGYCTIYYISIWPPNGAQTAKQWLVPKATCKSENESHLVGEKGIIYRHLTTKLVPNQQTVTYAQPAKCWVLTKSKKKKMLWRCVGLLMYMVFTSLKCYLDQPCHCYCNVSLVHSDSHMPWENSKYEEGHSKRSIKH